MIQHQAVENDTATELSLTLKDADTLAAINLTGCTVKLRWRDKASNIIEQPMTVLVAASGTVKYTFTAGQLYAPCMSMEVVVTDAGGDYITSLKTIDLNVRQTL